MSELEVSGVECGEVRRYFGRDNYEFARREADGTIRRGFVLRPARRMAEETLRGLKT